MSSEIVIFKTQDGKTDIDVKVEDGTVWLTQGQMVELFNTTKQNISLHIKNIFDEGEADKNSVVKEYLTTAADGKNYNTKYYNLDVIISVGYRVKSNIGTQFRIWASQVLKEYMVKGFAMNDRLLKEAGGGGYWQELLARIRDKPLPPIPDDEVPFSIPPSWKWVRLGEIVKYTMGKTPSRNDYEMWGECYNWVSISDLIDGKTIFTTKEKISQKSYNEVFRGNIIPAGTLLMSFKLTIGKVSILGFDGFHNEAILYSMIGGNIGNMVIVTTEKEFSIKNVALFKYYNRNLTSNNYLYYILKYVTETFKNKATGGAQPFISLSFIRNFPIPLPPLAKQHRIVAKVNELMQYCEKLKN